MKNIIKFSIILFLLINVFAIGILTVKAAPLLNDPTENSDMALNAKSACMTTGTCELNDFTRIAINATKIILGIVGSLALLAFVAGGLMMMLSAGNPEWVTRGKQTLIGAVVGLVIVFTSYMIIQLVFTSLGISGNWATSTWFNK
ncbi:MAG: hypothetical protein PHF50_00525 [Patescibacteria group bacterium]|nr:hypothetical protein [Patescibacteria group bacterium]